jgi:hypothetical protein
LTAAYPDAPQGGNFEAEIKGPGSETINWNRMRFVFKRYATWDTPPSVRDSDNSDFVRLPMSVFDMEDILKTLEWA